jgi:hypothetical protein
VHRRGIELHPHRRLFRAVDRHLADPIQLAQPLPQDGVRRVIHLRRRQRLRRQRQGHDRRLRRVELAVERPRRQVGRQVAGGGVDGGLHVVRRALDRPVDIELDDDAGAANGADRGDLRHPGDLAQPALQW